MMQKTKPLKNPGKQRKRFFNSPAHIRHKLMSAPLSPELASSRGVRSMPIRKGDTVRVMRGDNKGFEGKVSRVALNEFRIYLEGLTREKVDGTNIFLPIHPSKVQIRNLNLDDKWRKDIIARKKPIEKPEEEKPKATKKPTEAKAKPAKKVEKVEEEKVTKEIPAEETAEAPEEAPAVKKPHAKKPAVAKKPSAEMEEAPAEEVVEEEEAAPAKKKAPAKKTSKPKEATGKAATKPRAKRKASEEAQGGQ